MSGQILDASLIPAPRQHLDDGEKAAIKDGKSAAEIWPDQPAKARKDVDARWTVKHSRAKPVAEGEKAKPDIAIPVFGYKNHIGIDRRYGLIRTWLVSDAKPTMALGCARTWIAATSPRMSGPIPPTEAARTNAI